MKEELQKEEVQSEKGESGLVVSVQMKPIYMFDFLFWHSYHGIYGVMNFGFSLIGVILLICGVGRDNAVTTGALVLLALLFTVINPLLLYQKAYRQVKRNPLFKNPIFYELKKDKIIVKQGNETADMPWENMLLLRETRTNLALYFGASNAIVLPKKELGDKTESVKNVLRETMPEFASRLKKH